MRWAVLRSRDVRPAHAVGDSFEQLRSAAIERLENLFWWSDAQGAARQLEGSVDTFVDCPMPRHVDELSPIDERVPTLQIKRDVLEPGEASRALGQKQ